MAPTDRFRPFVTVYVLLRRGDEVLFLERKNSGYFDGYFSLPAGHIEGGETLTQTGIRETAEEVCITVSEENLKFMHLMHRLTADREYLYVFFETRQWEGEPVIGEPERCGEVRWCKMDQLPEKVVPEVRQALEAIQKDEYYGTLGFEGQPT